MFSVLQFSTNTKYSSPSDLVHNSSNVDLNTYRLMHSSIPPTLTARNSLADISNVVHCSPATGLARADGTLVDDLTPLSHPYPIIHLDRVATDCHDVNAWTQQRKLHDTKLDAVAASPSLGSNGTGPDDCSPADGGWNSSAPMEFRMQERWAVEQYARLHDDPDVRPHDQTLPVSSGSGVSPVRPDVTVRLSSLEDLSDGRRRVGEILVRCGVIEAPGPTPIESTTAGCGDTCGSLPVGAPGISSSAAKRPFRETDGLFTSALADWTSEWLHTLVIQPYLQGGFRFQYYGKSSKASTLIASRIRRVLSDVGNPVQVAIHTLWLINTLTGNGAHGSAAFLSVPMFRYLHNNGTFIAEDFMFRTFVACVMIGDKTVNDATLSTTSWNRLTRVPQVILNATEKYALSCLEWNVVMTRMQWQDTIVYLRSCIKMGSAFDPFAYDEASPSGIMARYLDQLIDISYADEPCMAWEGVPQLETLFPHPIRHFEVFDTVEWRPEDDPVINKKPRTVGIAPGADQTLSAFKVGTTAKDLLDSILGSSNVPDLAQLARPVRLGTSFCGSFRAPLFF